MLLRHIHLPSNPTQGIYPSYALAATIQEHLRRVLLSAKDQSRSHSHPSSSSPSSSSSSSPPPTAAAAAATSATAVLPLPPPTLLTFTPLPTYTYGRRQTTLDPSETSLLAAPLTITTTSALASASASAATNSHRHRTDRFRPAIVASPRGGLTTYHGPGQVVLWPVVDIGAHARPAPLTVRTYARALEETNIALLRRRFGLAAFTTADPGVWVAAAGSRPPDDSGSTEGEGDAHAARKIAAMGVHLRRHVSALGVALNIDMPTTTGRRPADGDNDDDDVASNNPWARFVACGLEGKGVTCVREEVGPAAWAAGGRRVGSGEDVAAAWAEEFAERIGLEGVERVGEDEVARLMEEAERKMLEGGLE